MIYVQFKDSSKLEVVGVFNSPQSDVDYPNQSIVDDDDTRYVEYRKISPDTLEFE
mgnify:CR=1 FL=1